MNKKNTVMEAPEKIYLDEDESWHLTNPNGDSVEYIRTDAFIEEACEFLAENMKCDGYTLQTKAKFIRGFRNYMKGE